MGRAAALAPFPGTASQRGPAPPAEGNGAHAPQQVGAFVGRSGAALLRRAASSGPAQLRSDPPAERGRTCVFGTSP